jgi:PHD/YefM family antitoxin component YafN of YafNO toxin-antitoxin module
MVEDIKSISYLKSHTADSFDKVNETHRPLIFTQNGEVRAVLIDPETFQNLNDGMKIMKLIAQSELEIQKGKKIDQRDLFARLDKRWK